MISDLEAVLRRGRELMRNSQIDDGTSRQDTYHYDMSKHTRECI